ncbi:uncharacterized protein DUF4870 [Psychrobacillus insolitus]|uniref:Uncharacterized protein DUF4870 n=1 Tax=Psychrobacillus insolitus TaxID=1461 RepID=A0A2W7N3F0_9BACI|nr:DUF4870 domain-containing protein [Psychrobacillus insolitus]PZX03094.1 uncharacterized protein DUF4870 [Psychrobacillus insolitus]
MILIHFENNKVLASLSYFSVLFAPFILPIIVYFISQDSHVKQHAKRALVSHIIPVVLMIVLFITIFASFVPFSMNTTYEEPSLFMTSTPLLFVLVYMLIYAIIFIWNIIQGIKVLR